jgi:hypothetical protein
MLESQFDGRAVSHIINTIDDFTGTQKSELLSLVLAPSVRK